MVWVGILIIVLTAVYLWFSSIVYRFAFHSPNFQPKDPYAVPPGKQYEKVADRMLQNISNLEAFEFEEVSIRSFDGTKLSGRIYRFFDRAPLMIQFHGYRGNALREFANGYQLAQKLGFNVLLVDQRAHGKSGGHTITFGIWERKDCKAWAWYAKSAFGENTPILLSGVSMGAATVLMASDLPLPDNVVGILADCPYSSPVDIILKVASDRKYPSKLVYPFLYLGARLFGRFDIKETSAVKAAANSKLPILLIHGEDDRFVPCEMSRLIAKKCSTAKLHTFPNAGHGLSYTSDPDRYEAICYRFLSSLPGIDEYIANNNYVCEVLQRTL